jgi:hypothetical protein
MAPHALQSSFGPTIAQLVHQYNTTPPTDELSRAQAELAQVKDIMVQNVEQILSRGERIELLVDKTDTMASQATAFRRGARTVRRQMWWRNKRVLALGILVVLVRPWLSPCSRQLLNRPAGDSIHDHGPVLRRGASVQLEELVSCSAPHDHTRPQRLGLGCDCNLRVYSLLDDPLGFCFDHAHGDSSMLRPSRARFCFFSERLSSSPGSIYVLPTGATLCASAWTVLSKWVSRAPRK